MTSNNILSDKSKSLLDQKENLIKEIGLYEQRIKEFQNTEKSYIFQEEYSSDSEDEDMIMLDLEPNAMELKREHSELKTCLQATQELTNLQILQSEVNLMTKEPPLEGEPSVSEGGTWRDVAAECRMDLIPFSIMFYAHKPNRKFAPTWYRGLNLVVVKKTHEEELSKSCLANVKRPGDAIAVIKSYAEAYRSRRTTLAKLAELHSSTLHMEPMAEGGFTLKCANVLEISWRLENQWSPVLPFHHLLKFDLEYMEEKYLNLITQTYKKLSDPTLMTDERTLLLSKIISVCLEAKGHMSESVESDLEAAKIAKRSSDVEQEGPEAKKKKENEVMAPPKTLPKKSKAKIITDDKRHRERPGGKRSSKIMELPDEDQRVSNSGNVGHVDNTTAKLDNNTRIHSDNNTHTKHAKSKSSAGIVVKDTKNPKLDDDNNNAKASGKLSNEKRIKSTQNAKPAEDISNDKVKSAKVNTGISNKENIVSNANDLIEINVASGTNEKVKSNKIIGNKVGDKKVVELEPNNKKTSPQQKKTHSSKNKDLKDKKTTSNQKKKEQGVIAVLPQKKIQKNSDVRKVTNENVRLSSSKKANINDVKNTAESNNNDKGSNTNVANPKNKTADKAKHQEVNKVPAKSKKSQDENTKSKSVGPNKNAASFKNKDNIEKTNAIENVAMVKNKPRTEDLVKKVTKVKNKNLEEYHEPGSSIGDKSKTEHLVSSGDKVKKIDNPKYFIGSKTVIEMKNNHTTKVQTSVGKLSRIPQKMPSNISFASSNKFTSKISSQSDASVNFKKISTNIPRYKKNLAKKT